MQVLSVDGTPITACIRVLRSWVARPELPPALAASPAAGPWQRRSRYPWAVALAVVRHDQAVLWCRFADLCEQPFSALDFIELCDRFTAILISDVPRRAREGRIARGTEDAATRVAGDRQLPTLAARDDAALHRPVDERYDRRIPLHISKPRWLWTSCIPRGIWRSRSAAR